MATIGIDIGAYQHAVAVCHDGQVEADRRVLRITADRERSAETEIASFLRIVSGPRQTCATWPVATATLATPVSPSKRPAKRIVSVDCHVSQLGDAGIFGVTFRAMPPWAGMTKMSPPVEPSSLMMPAMNAMLFPSGDQRGTAICKGGL